MTILPEHWKEIFMLLTDGEDDAMRDAARQAFADNPQRILTHAAWLAEQLDSKEGCDWSTTKVEVLRLFSTLQPPELLQQGGGVVVASALRTLTTLDSPPTPTRNSQGSSKGGAEMYREMVRTVDMHREMVRVALLILHKAPHSALAPLTEKLVDVALHEEEALQGDGRKLLQKLEERPRQRAVQRVMSMLGDATEAVATASRAEPYTKVLKALAKGDSSFLHLQTEKLVHLATGGPSLGAEVASMTLPNLEDTAEVFEKVVKQLQAADINWRPESMVSTLKLVGKLVGKLGPEQLSRHEHTALFFEQCLLHSESVVRLSFEVEILCKESCTGALLAPHAPLLLKAMESQGSIAENHREGLRQGLVRALARLSNEELRPHVESLRMLMEREEAEKVRLEMIKLPECILSLCSKTVRWLADVRPSS